MLVTYAVGILLLAMGLVTLLFSRHPGRQLPMLWWFLLIKVGLWVGRLVLELFFPIRLAMFGLDPFTAIVLPGLTLELALFVFAALQTRWLLARTGGPVLDE